MPNWRERIKPYRLSLVLAIAVFALFVWPTPYSYRVAPVEGAFVMLRMNRITGRITGMLPGGRRLKVNPGWVSELESKLYSENARKPKTRSPTPSVSQSGSSQPPALSHGNFSIKQLAAKIKQERPDLAKYDDVGLVLHFIAAAPQFQRYLSYEAQAQLLQYELRKGESKTAKRSGKPGKRPSNLKARERK